MSDSSSGLEQSYKHRKSAKRAGACLEENQFTVGQQSFLDASASPPAMADEASLASFLTRLMSLSADEVERVKADQPLMRQLADTRLLLERSLQSIHHQQHQRAHHLERQQQQQCLLRVPQLAPSTQPQHHHQNLAYISADSRYIYQFGAGEQLHAQQALDLRLPHGGTGTPGRVAPDQQPSTTEKRQLNPKKVKLGEWRREQVNQQQLSLSTLQAHQQPSPSHHQQQQQQQVKGPAKRYKGEFDEPSWAEVEQRQRELTSGPHNYHRSLNQAHRHLGECACVLGSRFQDQRPVGEILSMIDSWSRLPIEQRLQAKWDLCHLPVDIPLADIKKYEDLRRQASGGRADFGGASKRKPLGIRGTRQFLLILYCLWGHPGRQDRMQREGYCPHCFAKIKKSNEQSTLVRVVNHFNMKHRKGANPRLSPAARHHHITSVSPVHTSLPILSSPQVALLDNNKLHHQPPQDTPPNAEHHQQQKSNLFANLLLLAASSATAASPPVTPQASPPASSPDTATATATCRLAAVPETGTTQGGHHAVA